MKVQRVNYAIIWCLTFGAAVAVCLLADWLIAAAFVVGGWMLYRYWLPSARESQVLRPLASEPEKQTRRRAKRLARYRMPVQGRGMQ